MLEMGVVDVRVHSEQPFEDYFDYIQEVLGEGNTKLAREDLLIVQLVLNPSHQKLNILRGANFQGRLHVVPVGPQVLVLGSRRHGGTRLGRAELRQDSVEHVYLVVEFDGVNRKPLVQVFPRRQFHCQLHVPRAKSHARNLF